MDSYLLIIVPPQAIIKLVDKYRKRLAKYTQYRIPPHFTVYPPFYSKYPDENELIIQAKKTLSKAKPFKISVSLHTPGV